MSGELRMSREEMERGTFGDQLVNPSDLVARDPYRELFGAPCGPVVRDMLLVLIRCREAGRTITLHELADILYEGAREPKARATIFLVKTHMMYLRRAIAPLGWTIVNEAPRGGGRWGQFRLIEINRENDTK